MESSSGLTPPEIPHPHYRVHRWAAGLSEKERELIKQWRERESGGEAGEEQANPLNDTSGDT